MTISIHMLEHARSIVLQCFDETCTIREDVVNKLTNAVASWMELTADNQRNTDYYLSLLDQCAANLGPVADEVFIQDDGGRVDSPLRAKMPELVAKLAAMVKPKATVPAVCSLNDACHLIFGGVSAASPEIYRTLLSLVAHLCGRNVDDSFRAEVRSVVSSFPMILD